ncbi:ABC1 kinase family protein [Klebsiella sp. S69]|uniref:ABC1 kinase family protein n=1 Tax=Klebsiella sp. S69 TaxID=2767439 RepID=UPI0019083366|nr:AarF/UbiB family protein [Klebsiella sp. S69]MBK0167423.1 AarF/ABC1/UbiB kinase family protein [Klebsiella sp. S69]
MIKTVIATARDRARLQEITKVLLRYGLQDLMKLIGLAGLVSILSPRSEQDVRPLPVRVSAALEELGPAFIKLGQILSTRSDLLTPEWSEALGHLNANTSPLLWSSLETRFVETLGDTPRNLFAWFDETPLASGSIAQIHRARLKEGDEVVVKIQRPNIEATIRADLRILHFLAENVEQRSNALARFSPVVLVRYLENALLQELDFRYEAANSDRLRNYFAIDKHVVIPKVYWHWTRPRIMVQEFLHGTSPLDRQRLDTVGLEGKLLARRGAEAFIKMVFDFRIYHADPHPGNVMALEGNRVGFIDFGMVGHLSEIRRDELISLIYSLSRRDIRGIVDALIVWSVHQELNIAELELAANYFMQKQGSRTLQLGKVLTDMLATAREFHLSLPPDLVLLFKALITADGVLITMDPQFDIIELIRPYLKKKLLQRYSRFTSRRRMVELGNLMLDSGNTFPQTLRLLIQRLRYGRLHADINVENISQLGRSLERAASTLALAIVLAATVLALTPWLLNLGLSIYAVPVIPVILVLCGVGVTAWLIKLLRLR